MFLTGEEFDLSIPFYVMGGLSVLASSLVMLLPESSTTTLPNTLEDAIGLENKKRYNCMYIFKDNR